MAKTKKKRNNTELEGVFIFKVVLYAILGSLWLKLGQNSGTVAIPLPIGLLIGFILTTHDHFQIDRKIEYAVLIVAALFGYIAPYGLYVSF